MVLAIIAMAGYAINRGVYVGSERYVSGIECCPNQDVIVKRCLYLFVTGISEISARDGVVSAPRARTERTAMESALKKPDNGYCRLFAE
jgi:hypothetical protein